MMRRIALIIGGIALAGGALVGCFHQTDGPNTSSQREAIAIEQSVPAEASVNEPFEARVTVTAEEALPAISLRADFDGLALVDQGDFLSVEGNVLQGVVVEPAAGASQTFRFEVQCEDAADFNITAIAQSKNVKPVWTTSTVSCD